MKKVWLIVLVVNLLAFVLFVTEVSAQDEPVRIRGADFARFDVEKQLFYAEGDVVIEVDDIVIYGDRLIWDMEIRELHFTGNVELQQYEQRTAGENLVYNIDNSHGEFESARTELESENIEGPVFVFGKVVEIDGDNYHLNDGKISTCDLEEPHYHLSVKSIDVYPGDKLVIRGVTFYEGRLPLFYWPYLAIPLDKRYDNSEFTLPEIGYNSQDGYYIKNRYNYYFSSRSYGTVLYDYYTIKGLGLGIDHNYDHRLLGEGKFAFYILPFSENKSLVAHLNHLYETGGLSLRTRNSYIRDIFNGTINQNVSNLININYQQDNLRASAKLFYDADFIDDEVQDNWEIDVNWRQNLTPELLLNARSNIIEKAGERTLDNLLETRYRLDNHEFTLALAQRYNPELLEEGSTPNWKSIHRLPEFTWQWRNPGFKDKTLNGRFELSLGNLSEYPSGNSGFRVVPKLDLFTRSWRSDFGTTISYSGNAGAYLYSDNLSQQIVEGRVSLAQKITDNIRFSSTYRKRLVWGETPFKFDKQSPQDSLTGNIRFAKQPFTISVGTGYNFLSEKFNNLSASVGFNNRQGTTFNLSSQYNLNTKRFGNLTGRISYDQDHLTLNIGSTYHIGNQRLSKIDGKLSIDLTETIKLNYEVIYDVGKTQKFTKGAFVLTFDLHCRQLLLSYNHVKQEVALQYSINAFPKLPVGYSSTEGISLFELSDLRDQIGID